MRIRIFENIKDIRTALNLETEGIIAELDIDIIESECDLYERKRRDAEVLTTLAANVSGNCLDLGTSYGRSAYEIAMNIKERGKVYTLNILPEQVNQCSGKLITHILDREEIGSYYRDRKVKNVQQIYADTASWNPSEEMHDLKFAFVDAAHDTIMVYRDSIKAYSLLSNGGYIVWHDFNPALRHRYKWIDQVMTGVERFCVEFAPNAEILHLRNSWMGVLRKSDNGKHKLKTQEQIPVQDFSPAANPRVLLGYSVYPYQYSVRDINEAWLERLRRSGFQVDGICLTLNPPGPCLHWSELDMRWRRKDPELLSLYKQILLTMRKGGYEIFVNYNGINLHPDFVQQLRRECITVYCCFDDPESSNILSRPVAAAYDLSMAGNIAELDSYRAWGCRYVEWLPIGFREDEFNPSLSEKDILQSNRPIDIALVCERTSPWRRDRLDKLVHAFPQGQYFGNGWPSGFLPEHEKLNLYQRTKIGFNLHNSTGPINYRTFTVPANGAMLLCDNSSYLNKIFDIGVEAVGYDYIDEAIFHAHFYLAHEQMRKEIAAAGWRRTLRDYNESACFRRILSAVDLVRKDRSMCMEIGDIGVQSATPPNSDTAMMMMSILKPGMKWMDVGAKDSYYALLFSRLTTKAGIGWALELKPHPSANLQHHVMLNRSYGRAIFFNKEPGEKNGIVKLCLENPIAAVHRTKTAKEHPTCAIEISRLDDFSEIVNGPPIDFIKIEIDGKEPFFLKGARRFFSVHRPIIVIKFDYLKLLLADESVEALIQELNQIGYCVYSEKTFLPFCNALSLLKECENSTYSTNAWALPTELSPRFSSFRQLIAALPRNYRQYMDIFSSMTDMLLAQNAKEMEEVAVRVNAIEHHPIYIRGKTSDYTVLWDALHFKYHLPPKTVKDYHVIVDIGCNIGITTAHLAEVYPEARILAVEMDEKNCHQALRNTEHIKDRCSILQAAIWSEDGEVTYTGHSDQGYHIEKNGKGKKVRSLRVNTLFYQNNIEMVDYLKMDIEGAEMQVFLSSPTWLNKVRSLKVEIHALKDFDIIWEILTKYGFVCAKERRHYCCIEAVWSNKHEFVESV